MKKLDVQRRLGARVQHRRQGRHLTQEKLAERSGYTVKFISSIERGQVNVPLRTLCAVARALNMTASELLVGVDAPLPREFRTVEQLAAGRSPAEQAAVVRLLSAVADVLAVARAGAPFV